MHELTAAGRPRPAERAHYEEDLRVPAMSVGTYTIPVGGHDPQGPHREDEIYVVTAGRARLWSPGRTVDVAAGSVLFVPAGEEHRFVDVAEELTVLVVFAPAETTGDGA